MKTRSNGKKLKKGNYGITLIALVITIALNAFAWS